jgi:hypothetical protein
MGLTPFEVLSSASVMKRGAGRYANALVGGNKIMLNPVSFGDARHQRSDMQSVYAGTGGRRY